MFKTSWRVGLCSSYLIFSGCTGGITSSMAQPLMGFNLQVIASDAPALRLSRGEGATVMGRVLAARMVDGQLQLMMDGGHLLIVIATGKPEGWERKLIELQGNVEDLPNAKPGKPSLKIYLRTADKIRVIAETPAGAASKLVVREKPTNPGSRSAEPPGPSPTAEQLAAMPASGGEQVWTRVDGTKSSIDFWNWSWEWRQRLGSDLKTTEWVVTMLYGRDGRPRPFYPEDLRLIPADEERLRLLLWKRHETAKNDAKTRGPAPAPVPAIEGDWLAATEAWLDRIAHWGDLPLVDDPKAQRLPGPRDFGNLPDLRQLTEVNLRRPSPLGRQAGKLQLLDWAMTAEPTATKVKASIRWEDGVEEILPALDVYPNIIYRFRNGHGIITQDVCLLIYMMDWTRSKQLPGAEFKIRAIRQFLKVWWESVMIAGPIKLELAQQKKAQEKPVAPVPPAAALNAPSRHGFTLPFPGLPPVGFKELTVTTVDRTLLKPLPQVVGKQKLDDNVANMVAAFLWWDAAKVVTLPEKWGQRRRDEMLLTLAERYLKGGFDYYRQQDVCYKMLEGRFFMQVSLDNDYSPGNLARLTVGHHTVMLHLSVWDGKQYRFPLKLLVHTCGADGTIVFSTWGELGNGRLNEVTLHPSGKRPSTAPSQLRGCFELQLTGSAALMNYLKSNGYRLVLDDWEGDCIEVVTPWALDPSVSRPKK